MKTIKKFEFAKGIVQVREQTKTGFDTLPFELAFLPYHNNGWGITKEITKSYAEGIDKFLAQNFYFKAVEMLGLEDRGVECPKES